MSNFTITFKGSLNTQNKYTIIDSLETNFRDTYHKEAIRIGEDKLIITGVCYDHLPSHNVLGNMWVGFTNKVEVRINNDQIYYSIDLRCSIFATIISLILGFIFFLAIDHLSDIFSIIFLCVILGASIIRFIFILILHWNLFFNTLKYGPRLVGYYDWDSFLKTKSVQELRKIVNGNTYLTKEVQELAVKELNNRKDKKNQTGS